MKDGEFVRGPTLSIIIDPNGTGKSTVSWVEEKEARLGRSRRDEERRGWRGEER